MFCGSDWCVGLVTRDRQLPSLFFGRFPSVLGAVATSFSCLTQVSGFLFWTLSTLSLSQFSSLIFSSALNWQNWPLNILSHPVPYSTHAFISLYESIITEHDNPLLIARLATNYIWFSSWVFFEEGSAFSCALTGCCLFARCCWPGCFFRDIFNHTLSDFHLANSP